MVGYASLHPSYKKRNRTDQTFEGYDAMKTNKFFIFIGLMVVLPLLITTNLWSGELVTATGVSFFEAGREALARTKALDEAKRAAVEQVVGAQVESLTAVRNQRVIKDRILTHSSGYLKNVKIISEGKNSLGAFEVTIQAEVSKSALVRDMDRLGKLLSWQKNPRVSIFFESGLNKSDLAAAQKAAALLTAKLKNNRFKVYKYSKKRESQMGLLIGLFIESATHKTDYQGLKLNVNEISLTANTYRQGDTEILATAEAVKTISGPDRLRSLDKGVTQCVNVVWKKLRRKLIRVWEKEFFSGRDIDLVVNNVPSDNRANALALIFQSDVGGVIEANLVNFSDKKANFIIKYRGWPEQLVEELRLSYFEKKYFKVKVSHISGNQLIIKITD